VVVKGLHEEDLIFVEGAVEVPYLLVADDDPHEVDKEVELSPPPVLSYLLEVVGDP